MVGGETTKDRYYLGLITLGWESLPCFSLQSERIGRQRDGIEWATLQCSCQSGEGEPYISCLLPSDFRQGLTIWLKPTGSQRIKKSLNVEM